MWILSVKTIQVVSIAIISRKKVKSHGPYLWICIMHHYLICSQELKLSPTNFEHTQEYDTSSKDNKENQKTG